LLSRTVLQRFVHRLLRYVCFTVSRTDYGQKIQFSSHIKSTMSVCWLDFEYLCSRGLTRDGQFVLLGVYRPGSQAVSSAFFKEIATMFERLSVYSCPVVISGDFNVHVDDAGCADAVRLADLLQSFGYVQHCHNGHAHCWAHTRPRYRQNRH